MADTPVDPARKETVRQMRIKTGVVKRLHKEYFVYVKEVEREGERLQKMKDNGKDEYDIRKQQEVINESDMMLPDTKRKFIAAFGDLENYLGNASEYRDAEEYKDATKILDDTKDLKNK